VSDPTRLATTSEEFNGDGGARPSSLQSVRKQSITDQHYDLQLLRDVQVVNELTLSALGPLPAGGVPVESKRKVNLVAPPVSEEVRTGDAKEDGAMKIHHLTMAAAVGLASGCGLTGTHWHRDEVSRVEDGVLKIPFYDHGFDAKCYETLRCRVAYDNAYIVNDADPRGPFTERDRNNLGSHWSILDFPSVVEVSWTSKDGEDHDEKIDLGEIFRSRLIRYPADLDINDVNLVPYSGTPDIILVVEDRSIHVYMKAWIALRKPRYAERENSDFRHDLVVAFSHKF